MKQKSGVQGKVAGLAQRTCREEEALSGCAPLPRHEAASWRRRPGRHTKHTIGLLVKFTADSVMLNTLMMLFTPLNERVPQCTSSAAVLFYKCSAFDATSVAYQ